MVNTAEKLLLQVIHHDKNGAIYQIGQTRCVVFAPQITDEERERRCKEIQRVAWAVWNEMCISKIE
ncbi:hypothetical protein [Laceyella putida]|uniref:Uncharacterized protein n=1 Tax=Laceyella putida TaxID=110101 RepID=A0ABW2RKB9_9BACL